MYEFVEKSIELLKKSCQADFNNSRLRLLKLDELNVLEVRKESNRLFKNLRKESESFFMGLIFYLSEQEKFDVEQYDLRRMLSLYNPVLLYSFDTEFERKRARYFEAILAIGDMKNPRILEEQKKNIRYWINQVEETAIDIERMIFLDEARKRGVKKVRWVTSGDEKVCANCADLNGMVFDIGNVPNRSHIGCRCQLKEV